MDIQYSNVLYHPAEFPTIFLLQSYNLILNQSEFLKKFYETLCDDLMMNQDTIQNMKRQKVIFFVMILFSILKFHTSIFSSTGMKTVNVILTPLYSEVNLAYPKP